MKFIRPFFVFLLFVAISTILLSLLLPTRQKLERSVTINAPVAMVYDQLAKLEHFNEWSLWTSQDSTAKYSFGGTDGTVGAYSSWKGDPDLSGEGKMEITALDPGKKVEHSIHFRKPRKRNALSVFTLRESGGMTIVVWNFEMATPRPWNIFNLFYSMDKERGKDFENGLMALKKIVETKSGTVAKESYEVIPMNFPATRFATIRQKILWTDISSFYRQHLPILYDEATKAGISTGTASGLFFHYEPDLVDMAAAVPINDNSKMETSIITTVDIPASKAVYVNFYGPYDNLDDAYTSIQKYLYTNKLKQKLPAIEQYISGPMQEKDSTKWVTKIVYLVE